MTRQAKQARQGQTPPPGNSGGRVSRCLLPSPLSTRPPAVPEEQEHNHTGQRQRRNTGKGQNQNSGEGAGSDTGQPRFPQIQIAGNRRAAFQQNRQQYRVVRIEQGREEEMSQRRICQSPAGRAEEAR